MIWRMLLPALACWCVSAPLLAQTDGFVPFPIDWKAEADSPADLAFLLDAPAGKTGPVRIIDGHLVRGDGKRLRLWGVNATGLAGLPAKENAPLLARRLAQTGINCVRFHFLDVPAPRGLLAANRDDTQALDPAQLDRLDFFIAQLKERGIYADLNLNVAHPYKPGDGVRDCELLGFAKAVTYFDPRLIELQKQYARTLLTHRNPYTQAEYRAEPAVALVELVNENSLIEAWFSGRLLGKNTTKNPSTWSDIPASYEQDLTQRYNAWLKEKLPAQDLMALRTEAGVGAGEAVPRLVPKEFDKASKLRFHTEAGFYVEIEQRYFADMAKLLPEEIGVQAPLLADSDHNHGKSGYPHQLATTQLDVVDGHIYWQHPNYTTDTGTGRRTGFTIGNTPMVVEPLRSSVVQLSRSALAGKPYTVSEVNHPFPAESACEGVPILAAYAAFQDWDGIFWYTLGHVDPVANAPGQIGHFDLFPDPVKMAQLRAGALLFLRGDVAAAKQTVTRTYSWQQVLDGIRLPWSAGPYFTPGFDGALPLTHGVRIQSLDGAATEAPAALAHDEIRADTGELIWRNPDKATGLVTIDTARSQALIGHLRNGPALRHLMVRTDTPFCAVTLSALDDQPIANAAKLLLTVCGRVANTDMQWDDKRKTLEKWGKAPACIEPVTGTVTLRALTGVKAVAAQPLDGAGRPLGPALNLTATAGAWALPLAQPPTTWYVVTVSR